MIPFYSRCLATASRESRSILIPPDSPGLPAGEFTLVEWYCEDPKCDCRRALLGVGRSDEGFNPLDSLLTINFGWESAEYYLKWSKGDPENEEDVAYAAGMSGPSLEILAEPPEGDYEPLYDVVVNFVLSEPEYVARLQRHYAEFRATISPAPPWKLRRAKKPRSF